MGIKLIYHRESDYLIPDLIQPEEPIIGAWGRRRKKYLQQYRDPIYTGLLLSGKLKNHLEEIDRSALEMRKSWIAWAKAATAIPKPIRTPHSCG